PHERRAANPRRLADVLERSVAIVEVEDIRPVVAEDQVLVAIVVEITGHGSVAEARVADARFFGHVLEFVVPQVFVELVGTGLLLADGEGGCRDEVDIELAVAVVVEDGGTASVGRRETALFGHPRIRNELDSGLLADLGESERAGLALRRKGDGFSRGRG